MSGEPVIVVPHIAGRSDAEVIGAVCHGVHYERIPGETVNALAERAAQGRAGVVLLRYAKSDS